MSSQPQTTRRQGMGFSFLLGVAATAGFYALVFFTPLRDTMLYRYTTEHAVEYVIVALFCWGLMDVLLKVASSYEAASKRRVSPPAFPPLPAA